MSSSQSELTDLAGRDATSGQPVRLPAAAAAAGRAGSASPGSNAVRRGKVQPPPLRTETLERPRLLEWLHSKSNGRLVLITAEAGYGKTTLLADFARRTRLRTLWYRLESADGNGLAFISGLIAACQEHDPQFGAEIQPMLLRLDDDRPTREAVVALLLDGLGKLAENGALLFLDDFHLVDDSSDVITLVSDILRRGPERLSVVLASRRTPSLSLARLRSLGEVAELTANELRFDEAETAQLFQETFGRPLDAESIAELAGRTEGWAASLQLVEAALRSRSKAEAREFIRSLSAADGDLYDFLAEEVVGSLTVTDQAFLMRISVLESVDVELAAVVAGIGSAMARKQIVSSERWGLLARMTTNRSSFRFHPLVREFLLARLTREIGVDALTELHRVVARAAEERDWIVACTHYTAAGDVDRVAEMLERALGEIMATGQYAIAARFVEVARSSDPGSAVILSRLALADNDSHRAQELARRAVELGDLDEAAAGNLISVLIATAGFEEARRLARDLQSRAHDPQIGQIAELTADLIDASVDGYLPGVANAAMRLARQSADRGSLRYQGIALLNAAELWRAIGRPREALEAAIEARAILRTVDAAAELPTASSIEAWALTMSEGSESGRSAFRACRTDADGHPPAEVVAEFAAVEAMFGDPGCAKALIAEASAGTDASNTEIAEKISLASCQLAIREGRLDEAAACLDRVRVAALCGVPGREAWRLTLAAHFAVAATDPLAGDLVRIALLHARCQGAESLVAYCRVLDAVRAEADGLGEELASVLETNPAALSVVAEHVLSRIGEVTPELLAKIVEEASRRPERWRPALRRLVDSNESRQRVLAARLLDRIGSANDIRRLRRAAKLCPSGSPDRDLGRRLAHRLAPRIFVDDQGRVVVYKDGEPLSARLIRRKVLALLCLLLTKPAFTAPRDEVLDAMWPDMAPDEALNSLNQTIYFLRRVFEPEYVEDLSPGYINHDSELVWLNEGLVGSRSSRCAAALERLSKPPTPDEVVELSGLYKDRFAMDFAYEDWASDHRDTIHAAYLHAIEEGVRLDSATGHFRRGAEIARRALAIDPGAHEIEESLLRLYRLEGSHAAAAEQYGHYATSMRLDLDLDPPALTTF